MFECTLGVRLRATECANRPGVPSGCQRRVSVLLSGWCRPVKTCELETGKDGATATRRRAARALRPLDPVRFQRRPVGDRTADRVVLTDGRHLQLTPRQLGLLVELLRHAGSACSREQLMAAVWGPDAESGPRAVDVAIARLRAQLRRRIPGVSYIHTDFRSGYRFAAEGRRASSASAAGGGSAAARHRVFGLEPVADAEVGVDVRPARRVALELRP